MVVAVGMVGVTIAPASQAEEFEAFTEPYRRVHVASAEMGVITEIAVREGQHVQAGHQLARLDDRVLQKSLAVARAAKDASGGRLAAQAEVVVRAQQVASYRQLLVKGNATPRELERAENDHAQALARLQSVTEELAVRELEHQRVASQLEQRRIRAPIAGVVVELVKEAGEFVSPTDPVVLHLVQLDSLKAMFSLPIRDVASLSSGDHVVVWVGADRNRVVATVEYVSPVAHAESGTVRVKVRLPNADQELRSGVVCWLEPDASFDQSEVDRLRISESDASLEDWLR